MTPLKKAAFVAAIAVSSAFAQTVPITAVQTGVSFSADRVDMGFGPMVPIPKGEWKVMKRYDFFHRPSDKNLVHVTLLNEDKGSPLKFVTFSTTSEYYFNVPSRGIWMCPNIPGTVAQTYGVSNSSFSYACSHLRSYGGFAAFLSGIERTNVKDDLDTFGHLNGMVRPYLADPIAMKELGDSPVLWQMDLIRKSNRQIRYSAGVSMPRAVLSQSAADTDLAALSVWFQAFGKEALNAVEGSDFAAKRFDVTLSSSTENVPAVAPTIALDDVEALPTSNPQFKQDYRKFLENKPAENRAFYINGKGTAWGSAAGTWPYNEMWAKTNVYNAGRGKQSESYAYSINDRVVWDPANAGK
nr:hypothetical protein [uncultured Rhodoferax sp.]